MKIRRFALWLAVAGLVPVAAPAQDAYPSKPVHIVVGFPPGAAADLVPRLIGAKLSEAMGQPFVVENKPGAGSNIAAEAVARAAADGYTLFAGTVANAINASLVKDLKFDFARDFAPVAGLASTPNLLVVHPSLPAQSVQELIAYAKLNPGKVMFGSSGNGTSPHLAGELFNLMAGTKLTHIPYKGSPQAATDLLAGRVHVMFAPASTVLAHVKSGALRGLASTGAARGGLPDFPTVAESGLPGFESSVWVGLVAPKGTPPAVIQRLNAEAARALSNPEVKAQLARQGLEPLGGSPADFSRHIEQEIGKWAKVVAASGAKAN